MERGGWGVEGVVITIDTSSLFHRILFSQVKGKVRLRESHGHDSVVAANISFRSFVQRKEGKKSC